MVRTESRSDVSQEEKIKMGMELLQEKDRVMDSNGEVLKDGETYVVDRNGFVSKFKVQMDSLQIPSVWVDGYRGYFRILDGGVTLEVPRCFADNSMDTDVYNVTSITKI